MAEDKNANLNLSDNFENNFSLIDGKFSDCPDLVKRIVTLKMGKTGCFFYIQGICDQDLTQRDFISPILDMEQDDFTDINTLQNKIPVIGLSVPFEIDKIIEDILAGSVVFIVDGLNFSISCVFKKYDKRTITEPENEKNVRGSHNGFIEDLQTNVATLRRMIKNTNLKFKTFKVGAESNQALNIVYLDNIANPKLLKMLIDKVSKLNYDAFLGIGYVENIITDHPNSIFPQYLATERPDKAVAGLLEGRFVLMLEGTPFVLIVPVSFHSFLQAPDDYNSSWIAGSFLVYVRMLALTIALFLPGIYIALLSFHYYMIPLSLIVTLAQSRTKVPIPPVVEAFLIELVIEMLREASIRLPSYISSSISIVGGLVIGQAGVQAGVVSNLMIIVIATAAIAGFTVPVYDMGLSIRILRYMIMITAAIFGIIGVVVPLMLLIAHLLVLDSLGQPYFQPIAPFKFRDLKDVNVRLQMKFLKNRPDIAKPKDKIRGKNNG